MTSTIDLTCLREILDQPELQAILEQSLCEAAPTMIARCEKLLAREEIDDQAVENIIAYRDSLIAKYGRPPLEQVRAGLSVLAHDWPAGHPQRELCRDAWAAVLGKYPSGASL